MRSHFEPAEVPPSPTGPPAPAHRRAKRLAIAALAVATLGFAPAAAQAPPDDGPGPNDSGKYGPTIDAEDSVTTQVAPSVAAEAVGTVGYTSPIHTFTLDDVIGNALGETDADNPNVIKDGDAGETLTGEDNLIAKDGSGVLYPINSTFGFDVQDFVGATDKEFDTVAEEGWVGELAGGGLQFSDAETAVLKSGNLIGTWAAGLGGSEIKASTEHFTVMEAVLSCYQTVPYEYWSSAEDHADGLPSVPSLQDTTTCANNALPNPVTDADVAAALAQLIPNEDSVIPSPTDLYLGTNYSVTEKDDGKVLYRWGQAVKRPTDIRFSARLPLPEEWATAEGKGYKVTKAELVLRHDVTNNPNDQIRPEDWENEGATGVLPGYTVDSSGRWLSTKACYEGDGDFIPEGTLLRDPAQAFPGALSSDLLGGFSNAWYTTIDRDPFGWMYRTPDGAAVGSDVRDDTLGELVSGPRWRMLSNKFGQDIPSLEIPAAPCDEPPYEKGTVKYEVGDEATTTINLLDWSTEAEDARWDDAASPFAWSAGWTTTWSGTDTVDGQMVLPEDAPRCTSVNTDGDCVTELGTTLTDGFDVSFYVKGDQKPLKVYDVFIRLEYEDPDAVASVDFGDAPETYGTAALSRVAGDTYLGASADAEIAALISDDATGDDLDGTDDEDGVTIPTLTAGESADLTVSATDGTLDVMVDWNADGDFDDADELNAGITTVPGDNTVPVAVPLDASGDTFARFVLTGADGVTGEVEDHLVTITGLDTDYGDAPASYDGADPAGHVVSTLAMQTVDVEAEPQSSSRADGDDLAGTDDEDGVTLSKLTAGKTTVLRVSATEAGYLTLWVDWDQNGVFDPGERAVTDQLLKAGTNAVRVTVPATAEPGASYLRARLGPAAGTGPTGLVTGGEVEDHAVIIGTRGNRG